MTKDITLDALAMTLESGPALDKLSLTTNCSVCIKHGFC